MPGDDRETVFPYDGGIDIRAIRAICFDLDDTLWPIDGVMTRAETELGEWFRTRYPRIPERFTPEGFQEVRAALVLEQPDRTHDLTFLRRETFSRVAEASGYSRDVGAEAFDLWYAVRNRVEPFAGVVETLEILRSRFRLASLSNGNADLAVIGLAQHFEVSLNSEVLGCAKPDARAYAGVVSALGIEAREVLFVGDHPHLDVDAPRAAGMQTVWVDGGGVPWPDELLAADARVSGVGELVALLGVAAATGGD